MLSCTEMVWPALMFRSDRMVCLRCKLQFHVFNLDLNVPELPGVFCPRCGTDDIEQSRAGSCDPKDFI